MRLVIGFILLLITFLLGYLPNSEISLLFQLSEWLIIVGGAISAFIIATPANKIRKVFNRIGVSAKGGISKDHYLEIICLIYNLAKMQKKGNTKELDSHITDPDNSRYFQYFKRVYSNDSIKSLIAEGLAIKTYGIKDVEEVEMVLEGRLKLMLKDDHLAFTSIQSVGHALPAFGIVAAIVGIISTMTYIDQDSTVIASHMSAALVGTLLGIFIAYGFISPLADAVGNVNKEIYNLNYCAAIGVIAFFNKHDPEFIAEIMRNHTPENLRSSVEELESYCLRNLL